MTDLTHITVKSRSDASRGLVLSHHPGEWDGTFTRIVQATLDDLLTDGPVVAHVTRGTDAVDTEIEVLGRVVAVTDDEVRFGGDVRVPLDEIVTLVVP